MEHIIKIYSKKKNGTSMMLEQRITITEEDILKLAVKICKKDMVVDYDRTYWAEIINTIH